MLEIRGQRGGRSRKGDPRGGSLGSRASRVAGSSKRGSRPGWIMPPSRYIRESIGRLRRPRTKGAATSEGAFIFTTTRPRNSWRSPPCPAPSFPWLSVLRGSAAFPPWPFPPLVVSHTKCAGINVRSLYPREKLTMHAQWIHREIRSQKALREGSARWSGLYGTISSIWGCWFV